MLNCQLMAPTWILHLRMVMISTTDNFDLPLQTKQLYLRKVVL